MIDPNSNSFQAPQQIYQPPQGVAGRNNILAKIVLIIVAVLIVGAVAAGAYTYITKTGLFKVSSYTEENLLSGILSSLAKIKSSGYTVSASLTMQDRDDDAKPFETALANTDELRKKYQNDYARAQDIRNILNEIKWLKQIPASLQSLASNKSNSYYRSISVKDPATKLPYNYSITDSGKNFALSVTFETPNAISTIRSSYQFSEEKTKINGKTVTFTKDSYSYFYLPSTPPKPFLVQLGDSMSFIPPETKASFSASAQSNKSDWKFNADATGDLGDFTYKFNVDALKKDTAYYFKINNLPTMFLGYIGIEKGKWIKVDPTDSDEFSFGRGMPEAEDYYKKHKQEIENFIKKIVSIADEEKLILLKKPVKTETIGGRSLSKYEIEIRKESVVPFYKRVLEEGEKTSFSRENPALFKDRGYLDYLQSPEFSEIFDYYQKNTALTLWIDSQGFPAIVTYSMRLVPSDNAIQLKTKQANLIFKLELLNINKPSEIKAPSDFMDAKDISNPYIQKGKDSAIKGNMAALQTQGAIYYDKVKSYDNWCFSEDYVFTKKEIEKNLEAGNKLFCECDASGCKKAKKWCASAKLSSGLYFCVDSTGVKIELSDAKVCSKGLCNNN